MNRLKLPTISNEILGISFWIIDHAVADPGFSRRGAKPPRCGANLLFGKNFLINCMEMKEIGPKWGGGGGGWGGWGVP